jgi:hypothetical protein
MREEMCNMTRKLVTMAYALNVVCCQGVEEIQDPVTYFLLLAEHLLKYVRATKNDGLKFEYHDMQKDIRTMAK